MKNKIISVLSIVFLLLFLTACRESDFPANNFEPNTKNFENGYPDFDILIETEQDYSNIVCFTDKEKYSPSFEKIDITIKNNNIGKGFYIFTLPIVEKYENNEWERINYSPDSYNYEEGDLWAFCGEEERKDVSYSSCLTIWNKDLEGKWSEGEYRAVIYVGKEKIYAPFEIEKE